jgi:hypothetical protein
MPHILTCLLLLLTIPGLSAAEPPAAVLDLSRWKLTLPFDTARKGNPDEVLQPELATFQDRSCFFTADSGEAVVFRAACGGLGTENSNYPRSELREMRADGRDELDWSTDDSINHVMEVRLAITSVPEVKRHVVCAQIHDDEDDVIMIRLEKKKLFVERNDDDDVPLSSDYKLGDQFTLRMTAGNGRIQVWYNDELKMDWKVSKKRCYFKVGCYTQSNVKKGDRPDAAGEVVVHHLHVTHRQR